MTDLLSWNVVVCRVNLPRQQFGTGTSRRTSRSRRGGRVDPFWTKHEMVLRRIDDIITTESRGLHGASLTLRDLCQGPPPLALHPLVPPPFNEILCGGWPVKLEPLCITPLVLFSDLGSPVSAFMVRVLLKFCQLLIFFFHFYLS